MTLDPRRGQIWHAMGLGPIWHARALVIPSQVVEPDAAESVDAPLASAVPALSRAGLAREDTALMPWVALEQEVSACTACALSRSRKQTVFGVGHQQAHWLLVGEAPGAEEDARGEPFVGQAGRLLDNMLASIGLSRSAEDPASAVYIANVLKCRPPGNRSPEPVEVARCEPFLHRQIALLDPRVVLVMGRFAAQSLLATEASIASLRGRIHHIEVVGRKVPVVVTYHPAYLLRNLADKAKSWADLCLARQVYGSTVG